MSRITLSFPDIALDDIELLFEKHERDVSKTTQELFSLTQGDTSTMMEVDVEKIILEPPESDVSADFRERAETENVTRRPQGTSARREITSMYETRDVRRASILLTEQIVDLLSSRHNSLQVESVFFKTPVARP